MKQISGRAMVLALAALMLAACSSTGSTAVHGTSSGPAAPTSTSTTVVQALAHGVEAPSRIVETPSRVESFGQC
jgi:hypothetical protein